MLAEITGHLNKGKNHDKYADDEINKMSEQQLKAFLQQKGVRIVEEKVINARPSDDKEEADG